MSELVSIVYRPKDAPQAMEGYTRVPLQEAELVVGRGIEGDAKGVSPDRQLNIMSAETLHTLAAEGFSTAPGRMGEQLILSGVEVNSLPTGARLQIGEGACVEITIPRTGCAKFEKYQDKQRQEAKGRLGVLARVLVGGVIRVGDPVRTLEESALQS